MFDAMRSFRFNMMGSMRSTSDFYRGYQFATTVNFVMLVMLLWLWSNLSRTAPRQAGPMVLTILAAQVLSAILGWKYFFAGPGLYLILRRAAVESDSRAGRGDPVITAGSSRWMRQICGRRRKLAGCCSAAPSPMAP